MTYSPELSIHDDTLPSGFEHPADYDSGQLLFWGNAALQLRSFSSDADVFPTPEAALVHTFDDAVDRLLLEDLMLPVPNREIAHSEAFGLTPIVGTDLGPSSLVKAGTEVRIREGITSSYACPDGPPCLDTRQAIGLTYRSGLIAVAGAGVDMNDRLFVTQIQDVTTVNRWSGRKYFKTGLHNGFYWRDTLVHAWEQVALDIGAHAVVVQSHVNSRWQTVRESGWYAYDDVADRMGYSREPISRNWVKPAHFIR